MVELNEPDLNNLDRIISHKMPSKASLPSKTIIPHRSAPVKTAATFISDEGETVVSQVCQLQKHLSEKEVSEIILAYQRGKSANVLAREYGCDRHTICDHLKKHGIKVTRNKIRSEESVRQTLQKSAPKIQQKGSKTSTIHNRHSPAGEPGGVRPRAPPPLIQLFAFIHTYPKFTR